MFETAGCEQLDSSNPITPVSMSADVRPNQDTEISLGPGVNATGLGIEFVTPVSIGRPCVSGLPRVLLTRGFGVQAASAAGWLLSVSYSVVLCHR